MNKSFLVFLSGSIYKTVTSVTNRTRTFFRRTFRRNISSFGEKKTVCVFVKRKRGLNEDLYDSEQFTYNVLCQLLPYNDITALLVAYELLAALSNCFKKKAQTVFQLQTRTKYFHTWMASLRCFYYIVFSTVEHKKKKIIFFEYDISRFWIFGDQANKQSDRNLITSVKTQNLQSSLPGTVVVEYASSKRLEENLVIVVVFYCYFIKNNCFEDI